MTATSDNNKRNLVILGFLLITLLFVWNWLTIRDWWIEQTYEPSVDVVRLADGAYLSDEGRRLFYISTPELNNSEQFNANCQVEEGGLVFGCYANWKIFILRMQNQRLQGVEEVTSAHEMLHAAYIRLSSSEREDVDRLLDEQLAVTNNKRILDTLKFYQENDPDNLYTEMYAIFGTELADLIEPLEKHLAEYFYDRAALVRVSDAYEAEFEKFQ